MESIIKKLSLGTSNLESQSFGFSGKPSGLDKLTELHNCTQPQIQYLYAVFLENKQAITLLRAHLMIAKKGLFKECEKYQRQIINAALAGMINNSYRVVDCYRCKRTGKINGDKCTRCAGTGKTSKKPKEYELCGINRNTWYSKTMQAARTALKKVVDYLMELESGLRERIKTNKWQEVQNI